MLARGLVSLHIPPLLGRNPSSVKSRISITSKLIEIKGLQLHYFGHLRKTGGRGEYRLVHTPPLVLNIPYLTTSFSSFRPPPVAFITQYPAPIAPPPPTTEPTNIPAICGSPPCGYVVLCLQVPQCPPLIARSWTVWNAAISSSPFFPPSLCLSLPAGWPLLCIPWCSSIRKKTRRRCAWPSSDSARLRSSSSGISSIASAPSPSLSSTCLPNWNATSRCSFRLARTCSTPCPTRTISGIA